MGEFPKYCESKGIDTHVLNTNKEFDGLKQKYLGFVERFTRTLRGLKKKKK